MCTDRNLPGYWRWHAWKMKKAATGEALSGDVVRVNRYPVRASLGRQGGGEARTTEDAGQCRSSASPAKLHAALCRQRQGVLCRQIFQRGDLLARRHQAVPADLFVEHVERVPIKFAGAHHRVHGAAEQPDQPTGLRAARRAMVNAGGGIQPEWGVCGGMDGREGLAAQS